MLPRCVTRRYPRPGMGSTLSLLRLGVVLVGLTLLSSACAATPTVTATRPLTAAEIAAADEAARNFEATPAYLARIGGRVEQAESMRFEVYTAIDSSLWDTGSRTEPVMTGERSGTESRVELDMGALMGPMLALGGLDRSALTMTMVADAEALYLNAPVLVELANLQGIGNEPEFAWVRDLAAGWGRIDGRAFDRSDILSDLGMSGGAGATEMLALLDSVGDVLDGGAGEVRGVPVRIAHAQVTVADILDRTGQDLDDSGFGRAEMDVLRDVSANVAVSVDEDGMIRRLEYTLDFAALVADNPQGRDFDLTMWQRVDYFDFGAPIDIHVPSVWTDVTDDLEDLLDDLG